MIPLKADKIEFFTCKPKLFLDCVRMFHFLMYYSILWFYWASGFDADCYNWYINCQNPAVPSS